jgi:hypothetical protein
MSGVLALARRYLSLSHGTVPRSVPLGQSLEVSHGTVPSAVPLGHPRDSGTNGTFGTLGIDGTRGTARTKGTLGTPDSQDEIDAVEERSSIAIELGDVPVEYAEDFARLQCLRLESVPQHDKQQAAIDAGIFLDRWGRAALENRWISGDIFCLPSESVSGGLVWEIKGRAVTAVGVDGIYRIDAQRPFRIMRHHPPPSVSIADAKSRSRNG